MPLEVPALYRSSLFSRWVRLTSRSVAARMRRGELLHE